MEAEWWRSRGRICPQAPAGGGRRHAQKCDCSAPHAVTGARRSSAPGVRLSPLPQRTPDVPVTPQPDLRVLEGDDLRVRHDAEALLVRAAVPALDDLVARLIGAGVGVRELAPVVAPLEAAFLALTAAAQVQARTCDDRRRRTAEGRTHDPHLLGAATASN